AVYAGLMRGGKRTVALLTVAWLIIAVYNENVYFTLVAQTVIYVACFFVAWRASAGTEPESAPPQEDSPQAERVGAA
ncbi:hypothetical protein AB0346_06000, partial [Nocardia beijingensis]|uniref:hypothetical protein n=1 Tax=Nocardia beijingensis TaxID=95162 RepID=UPI00344B6B69